VKIVSLTERASPEQAFQASGVAAVGPSADAAHADKAPSAGTVLTHAPLHRRPQALLHANERSYVRR
jgi:hypothetical protein